MPVASCRRPGPLQQGASGDLEMLSGHAGRFLRSIRLPDLGAHLAPVSWVPVSEAHPQTNAQLSAGHRGIKALLVCAWRTAMRNTDTRKGEISSAP